MRIDEIGCFSGVGFDMLKHKEFENLVSLFSSFRQVSRVYQGWLYEILLKVCFRNKLKNNQLRLIGACSIISCLSTGLTARFCFVSPGYAIQLFYPCVISCFSEQINLLTTCFKAEFQLYISQPWVLCTYTRAIWYNLLNV